MKRIRSFFYLLFAVSLLLYGLPRFQLLGIQSMAEGFAIIWTSFAVIIIGAHLYDFLDVQKEIRQKDYRQVRQYRANRW